MSETSQKNSKKKGFLERTLNHVERVGNALPDPATLFIILTLITIVASAISTSMGASVTFEAFDAATGQMTERTVSVVNLLSADSLRHLLTTVISSFTSFFPLGPVFTIILGVGVANESGFLVALFRRLALATPKSLATPTVIFLGVISSIASSTGYVVLVPLGAILFLAFGRHPIAGMAATFAGVAGGWGANIFISTNDPLLAGLSTSAAQLLDPAYEVLAVSNWYFMIASTFLITIVGTIITDKIIEPRLAPYVPDENEIAEQVEGITDRQKRGMRFAGISAFVYVIVMLILILPTNSLLRHPETGAIMQSPFMSGIIFFMMLLFLIPGLFYGIGAGTIKNDKDMIGMMNKSIASIASFLVLLFFAAQFTNAFNASNFATVIAISGANFFEGIGFTGLPLIVAFIIFTYLTDLFIPVDTAKWAMMAPIFVPMFMQLGLSPELTQAVYRIGDSCANMITPLMPFFVLTVAFFQKYDKKAGIGSVVSTMLPYSVILLISWTGLFALWYFLGLPLGPGGPLFYP